MNIYMQCTSQKTENYLLVKAAWSYHQSFRCIASVWQTDRQIDLLWPIQRFVL